ncbi:MAG: glycosyltransferase, partial [Candidatus Omnitrophota bacterium]|nr:glycosyltransferase [Candidatus Omnitrophota bacterium]
MKILLITTLFPHSTGGIGDYSYRLARHLSNGDDELHVLTSEDSHIIKTCNFCNIHAVIRSWSVAEYRSVLNIVGQVRPDIVHIQHDTTPYKNKKLLLNVLPLLIRIFYRKIRIVTTIHEFREHRLRWKLRALPMMIASDKCVFVDKWDMETARRQFGFIPSDKLT